MVQPSTKFPPAFENTLYVVWVNENTPVQTSILNVTTVNVIQQQTLNINEQSGRDFFSIDDAGTIRIAGLLNYEQQKQHIFTIRVQDRRNSGQSTVVVNVLNNNDECPRITPASQTVQITEPVQQNTIVAAVQASDMDTQNLTFTLIGGNNLFTIDRFGGIRTVGFLDITQSTVYPLSVQVSDAVCTRSAVVNVNVNPLAPCPDCNIYKFGQTLYEASIFENTIPANAIITVNTGANQFRNFSIEDTTALQYVSINPTTGKFLLSSL